jgi:chemotaxis protein MotB
MMKISNLLAIAAIVGTLASCVPARQYDEMKLRKATCDEENSKLRAENSNVTTQNKELTATNVDLLKERQKLESDTSTLGTAQRRLSALYNELNNSYEKLIANNDRMMKGKDDEAKKVIGQLQMTQDELIKKHKIITEKTSALSGFEHLIIKLTPGNFRENGEEEESSEED